MTEINSPDDLREWLQNRPADDARVLASRAALRVLPHVGKVHLPRDTPRRSTYGESIYCIFRATSLAWAGAKFPASVSENRSVYADAATFAAVAATTFAAVGATYAAAVADSAGAAAAAADITDAPAAYAARATGYAADAVVGRSYRDIFADADIADTAFAAASNAAGTVAEKQIWQSINADALALNEGLKPDELANRPLWPGGIPHSISINWQKLVMSLPRNEDWDIWTAWYDRRQQGRVYPEACELVFARVPDEEWRKGPASANAWIKAELAKLEPPAIPEQGAGPHVEIDIETGLIVPAKPGSLDEAGNHVSKLRALHPQLRQLAADLRNSLSRSNEHRELLEAVSRYDDLISRPLEEVDFDRLWGEGIFLEEAAAAAKRRIEDALCEPLSDEREAKLNALLKVHAVFILASKAGQENLAAANAFELGRDEIWDQQLAAQELAKAFKAHPEIIAPETMKLFADVVAQPDSSVHPERSAAFKAGLGQNIAVVIGSGAAVSALLGLIGVGFQSAAVGLIFWEALKKSEPFLNVAGLLSGLINEINNQDYDALAKQLGRVSFGEYKKFMLEHEVTLRRFAGRRTQGRWLHEHLDWLKRAESGH